MSSNLIYTIWAVFGGFILHFLLSNYLTVLLTPSYEKPVETAEDLVKRNITLYGDESLKQFLAASENENLKQLSRNFLIVKGMLEKDFMAGVIEGKYDGKEYGFYGEYADIGRYPNTMERLFNKWYRSTETIPTTSPYSVHLSNKKWPLKKVL